MNGTLRLALRLARRELRGGLRGFVVFIACLTLGVAAIAAAGSLNASVRAGLQAEARALLGGDAALRLTHRPATPGERGFLHRQAVVAETVEMRAMARAADSRPILVELKGVDATYPLAGRVELRPEMPLAAALQQKDGVWGAAADANLLTRLGLQLGQRVSVGDLQVELRATIVREPDRPASLFSLGPRLLVHRDALPATGLIQPGSLIRYVYLLDLHEGTQPEAFKQTLAQRFPEAGWQLRFPDDAAPGVRRFVDNMNLFLTLVGLTALLIGGVGVANAVRAFVDGRTATIAMLKCLGAPSRLVLAVYALQVGLIAALGILLGVLLGAALPAAVVAVLGDSLPFRPRVGFYPLPLSLAAVFGALVALAFGLWPLSRAAAIPPAALFRDAVYRAGGGPRRTAATLAAVAALALAAMIVATADKRLLAATFVIGSVVAFGLFRGMAGLLAQGAQWLSRHRPDGSSASVRLGLARLHRPGAATGSVVLSLGLGLTVLVAIALVEANLHRDLAERLPEEAPAFFFIDIQRDQAEAFDRALAAVPGVGDVQRAATIRGRITRLNGVPVEQATIAPEAEWAVRGDRGLTVAASPPEGTRIVAGGWWPADHSGPPLVSLDAGIAHGFGLGLGDTMSVNVLGREITATIASLREIDWSTMSMNFVIVLSPGALAGAPHTYIATVRAAPAAEDAVERAVTDALPNVSSIRVRQALDSVKGMLTAVGVAVRLAGSVTVMAGALVLAGAIAAGRRNRLYEAVVLKAVGATRSDLVRAYLVEYGLLGVATGTLAGIVGSVIAWAVLRFVMHADWTPLPAVTAATVAACALAVLVLGYVGTWRVLGAAVAPYLRDE